MPQAPSTRGLLRRFAREDPEPEEFEKIEKLLEGEDDRTAAIVGAADLENCLEKSISERMRSLSSEEYRELFEGDSAISTFAAKIKLAYAINVYGKTTKKDLDLIRDIRNAFAHSRRHMSFSHTQISAVCDLLNAYKIDRESEPEPEDSAKKKYIDSCYLIALRILITDSMKLTDAARHHLLP